MAVTVLAGAPWCQGCAKLHRAKVCRRCRKLTSCFTSRPGQLRRQSRRCTTISPIISGCPRPASERSEEPRQSCERARRTGRVPPQRKLRRAFPTRRSILRILPPQRISSGGQMGATHCPRVRLFERRRDGKNHGLREPGRDNLNSDSRPSRRIRRAQSPPEARQVDRPAKRRPAQMAVDHAAVDASTPMLPASNAVTATLGVTRASKLRKSGEAVAPDDSAISPDM